MAPSFRGNRILYFLRAPLHNGPAKGPIMDSMACRACVAITSKRSVERPVG